MREQLGAQGVSGGLVIEAVDASSDAAGQGAAGGRHHHRGRAAARAHVADFSDRVDAAEDAGQKSILLLIRRAGNPRFVALALPE
jgi:serine protease Do